ncbi:alpha/beta-hydrolase [Piromyces finnis]|uniref:Alpha/beta-hydrolase n=1 Tax=Piromyces finnis TaxID=1754191 RepID=A0A1Y1UX92_9FUNG|nr:alpha/beta-hydrolase [Piromyces finnis]|eukprot:ORX42703.1 alpha/beta-hydrolase [Piromyces finnis]
MKSFSVLSLIVAALTAKVSANLWEQPKKPINNAVNPWEQQQPEQNTTTSSNGSYMSKLDVVTSCPKDAISERPGVQYPTAKKIYYFSKITQSYRPLNVILPVGYTESKQYPVLYLLHGIMCNEDSMLEAEMGSLTIPTNLFNDGRAKEMIIVLPYEYAPEAGKEVEAAFNQAYFDGYDNFINELTDVIMPYVKANYSIKTGRENTAICGFSMGGRNSLYIGFKRSDLFGYVGAFSPAPGVTPGTDSSGYHKGLFTEDSFRAEISPIVALINCGTSDSVVGQFPKSYHEILTRNNQEHIWFEVQGADHNGVAVSAGFYNFILAAFGALN